MLDVVTLSICTAIIWMAVMSTLYRDNIFYSIAENLILGTMTANVLLVNLMSFINNCAVPLFTGEDILLIIPFILAFCYLGILSRRTMPAYRFVIIITTAAFLGVAATATLATGLISAINFTTQSSDPTQLICAWVLAFSLIYATFGAKIDKPLGWARHLGRAFIFMYLGGSNGPTFIARVNLAIGSFLDIVQGPGIYLVYVGALLILLDILVFRRVIGRKVEAVKPI